MNQMKYTVLLNDGTYGVLGVETSFKHPGEDLIGAIVDVYLSDENGNPVKARGVVVAVLDESEY